MTLHLKRCRSLIRSITCDIWYIGVLYPDLLCLISNHHDQLLSSYTWWLGLKQELRFGTLVHVFWCKHLAQEIVIYISTTSWICVMPTHTCYHYFECVYFIQSPTPSFLIWSGICCSDIFLLPMDKDGKILYIALVFVLV